MPENLQEEVREYFKNELSHIVEYYPLYKDKDIEEKKKDPHKTIREHLDFWLIKNGLDSDINEYRYVLITYQPL